MRPSFNFTQTKRRHTNRKLHIKNKFGHGHIHRRTNRINAPLKCWVRTPPAPLAAAADSSKGLVYESWYCPHFTANSPKLATWLSVKVPDNHPRYYKFGRKHWQQRKLECGVAQWYVAEYEMRLRKAANCGTIDMTWGRGFYQFWRIFSKTRIKYAT